MNPLLTTVSISILEPSKNLGFEYFSAKGLELDLLLLKAEKILEHGDVKIAVEELSLGGVHVARCATIANISELKTLIEQISTFAEGDFINLNRAIGTFDNSEIKPCDIIKMVDKIAPIAYQVRDNFVDGKDIRDKEKYTYKEVGKGILIGIPKE